MLIKNWKINLLALVLVVASEFVGQKKIQIGPGFLLFLPMLYALVLGGIISWPKLKLMSEGEMKTAYLIMGSVVMLFVSKLGTLLGPSLVQLAQSGWALSLQELGHFFGTIVIGLPLALFLGLKREAVGASFSIDREPNIAIIAEKYGMDSAEGRGVMGTYICGTIFGALYLGLLAGYIGSAKIFDPLSLAMGAGVGSGSMMAAASGAIAAAFPDKAKEVGTFAAASNLLTTVIGVYFCLFISLPVANKIYAWWPKKDDRKEAGSDEKMA
jgi:MFS family permease